MSIVEEEARKNCWTRAIVERGVGFLAGGHESAGVCLKLV